MKITIKINGVKSERVIPVDYPSLSFRKLVEIADEKDSVSRLSILLDIPRETLLKADITGLEDVLLMLSFLDRPMNLIVPKTIQGYKVPTDLKVTETGRYEDLKLIRTYFEDDKLTAIERVKKYPELVAIYAMPNYIDSDKDDQDSFVTKFWEAPCEEVLAIGNFTVRKWIELRLNIKPVIPKPTPLLKKLRLAFLIWRSSLVFSLRYYLWKKKLRTGGMNY